MNSHLLEVDAVEKDYRLGSTRLPVLRGLSLSARAGEIVSIMGPSGSGKTTLLNCISGVDVPEAGSIRIGGEFMDRASEKHRTRMRRERIGMVFQFFNLVPTLNAEENVALPFLIQNRYGRRYRQRAREMLERVGLGDRAGHYSFQLSGGEMQLVSIARALVHRPALLLADEPTGNVNPRVGRSIMEILRDVARQEGATVVMVTHSPEHAAWADRVCFLKDGVIAAELEHDGDHHNLGGIHRRLEELEI